MLRATGSADGESTLCSVVNNVARRYTQSYMHTALDDVRAAVSKDTVEEKSFREEYAQELRKMKQKGRMDELEDERKNVWRQMIITPGRKGEQIKLEEIEKEIVRRHKENTGNKDTKEEKEKVVP